MQKFVLLGAVALAATEDVHVRTGHALRLKAPAMFNGWHRQYQYQSSSSHQTQSWQITLNGKTTHYRTRTTTTDGKSVVVHEKMSSDTEGEWKKIGGRKT